MRVVVWTTPSSRRSEVSVSAKSSGLRAGAPRWTCTRGFQASDAV
jgi:hypothetical protein